MNRNLIAQQEDSSDSLLAFNSRMFCSYLFFTRHLWACLGVQSVDFEVKMMMNVFLRVVLCSC